MAITCHEFFHVKILPEYVIMSFVVYYGMDGG